MNIEVQLRAAVVRLLKRLEEIEDLRIPHQDRLPDGVFRLAGSVRIAELDALREMVGLAPLARK